MASLPSRPPEADHRSLGAGHDGTDEPTQGRPVSDLVSEGVIGGAGDPPAPDPDAVRVLANLWRGRTAAGRPLDTILVAACRALRA
ncbi:MAG TPA: hypothetical protein PKE32_08515 [Miltoncostaeaceae bacterium]|nr:hypothetical protein [Miltoncostaeaceae bacterium]